MACVICNTIDDLVDGIVATDPDGKQVILQLCNKHSDSVTPKQAKLAYEFRNNIADIIARAAERGLHIEIPTIIFDGQAVRMAQSVPTTEQVAEQAKPAPTPPAEMKVGTSKPPNPVMTKIQAADGSQVSIPATMDDNSRVTIVRRTDNMLQKHQKWVADSETSFAKGYDIRDCVLCRGSGVVRKSQTEDITCPKCSGSGMF